MTTTSSSSANDDNHCSSTPPPSNTTTTTTPNHNYAAPHTPIASVKRPRSSLGQNHTSSKTPTNTNATTTTTSLLSPPPPPPPSSAMSPMHPPKPLETLPETESTSWMGKAVTEALFSPMLHFLGTTSSNSNTSGSPKASPSSTTSPMSLQSTELQQEEVEEEEVAAITDDDGAVQQQQQQQPQGDESAVVLAASPTTSTSSSNNNNSPTAALALQPSEDLSEFRYCYHDTTNKDSNADSDNDNEDEEDSFQEEDEFNPYKFIQCLPPYALVAHNHNNKNNNNTLPLPHNSNDKDYQLCLVLDLDETLVHCQVDPLENPDLIFPVLFHGMEYQVYVKLRPHLYDFLEKIARQPYEVVVFTASQKVYAEELLNRIDPNNKYIHHRMFRESCLPVEGNFLKDLSVLGRDLRRTVLVDNSPHAFGYQVDNGIPIESWFEDPHDQELLKLEKFLRTLLHVEDVRTVVRDKFRTYELVERA